MDCTATGTVVLSRRNKTFITVDTAWFKTCIGTNLGNIYDCYIAEIFNKC